MKYTLYTTVDITNTGQYRAEPGKEADRWKEQNFQTVVQTIGIRANLAAFEKPKFLQLIGKAHGFNAEGIINVWRFDFETERDFLFEDDGNPVGYLITDFSGVPYISGLDESMDQNYDVFVTDGDNKNIVFYHE